GNLAGFAAPVFAGFLLQHSGGDWNYLIYTMVGAACVSASCWLVLDPESRLSAPGQAGSVQMLDAQAETNSL
ncbi:MAG TPA: hypothetical protein VGE93_22250, partial [Bryobacteraceae bacterium]